VATLSPRIAPIIPRTMRIVYWGGGYHGSVSPFSHSPYSPLQFKLSLISSRASRPVSNSRRKDST
jgi:hypothetical protein